MGREGEGEGREGRDQKMYCGFSKIWVFSSFPSLAPHHPRVDLLNILRIGLAANGNLGLLCPQQTGAPFVTLATGRSPNLGSAPNPTLCNHFRHWAKAVGTRGLVAVVVTRCINCWLLATCCGLSYGSQGRCSPGALERRLLTASPTPGRSQRQQSGPRGSAGTPLPTGNEVWLQTHSPWRGRISCQTQGARGSPQPLARPFLQAFREHSFFPEVDSPRCTSRELTGRWSLGLIRPGSPGGPGPLELGGHSQQTARASPGARESGVGRWAPGSRLHGAGWRAGAPASSLNPPSDCL